MRIVGLVVVMLLLVCSVAVAAELRGVTAGSNYSDYVNNYGLDRILGHDHDVALAYEEQEKYERKTELGVGMDLLYRINKDLGVESQNKYDFNNDEWGFYGVVKADGTDTINNACKATWDWLTGWFR